MWKLAAVLLMALTILVSGCASKPIQECKLTCANGKVEYFKDEIMECRCR